MLPGGTNHQGVSRATDDRVRISDADRERATGRLRDHFAEGRLTPEELDERVTAALNARTAGDLRRVMADLPEPSPVPGQGWPLPPAAAPQPGLGRRSPVLLPLVTLALLAVLLIPGGGGWQSPAFFPVVLVAALIACVAAIIAAARFRRRMRRR
jgi:hypothetical protein